MANRGGHRKTSDARLGPGRTLPLRHIRGVRGAHASQFVGGIFTFKGGGGDKIENLKNQFKKQFLGGGFYKFSNFTPPPPPFQIILFVISTFTHRNFLVFPPPPLLRTSIPAPPLSCWEELLDCLPEGSPACHLLSVLAKVGGIWASLWFEKRLNFEINPRKLLVFYPSFLNRNEGQDRMLDYFGQRGRISRVGFECFHPPLPTEPPDPESFNAFD